MGLSSKFLILTLGLVDATISIAETLPKPFLFSKEAVFGDQSHTPLVKTLDALFEKNLHQWRKWDNYDLLFIQEGSDRISIPIALLEFRDGFLLSRSVFQYSYEMFSFESKNSSEFLMVNKLEKTFALELSDQFNEQVKIWLVDFSSALSSPPKSSSVWVKLGYFLVQNPESQFLNLFSFAELEKFKTSYYDFMTDLNRISNTSH